MNFGFEITYLTMTFKQKSQNQVETLKRGSIEEKSKGDIFDVFYQREETTRAGGGMTKKKICRQKVSVDVLNKIELELKGHENPKLLAYFIKLKDRNAKIAPPPRPKN